MAQILSQGITTPTTNVNNSVCILVPPNVSVLLLSLDFGYTLNRVEKTLITAAWRASGELRVPDRNRGRWADPADRAHLMSRNERPATPLLHTLASWGREWVLGQNPAVREQDRRGRQPSARTSLGLTSAQTPEHSPCQPHFGMRVMADRVCDKGVLWSLLL